MQLVTINTIVPSLGECCHVKPAASTALCICLRVHTRGQLGFAPWSLHSSLNDTHTTFEWSPEKDAAAYTSTAMDSLVTVEMLSSRAAVSAQPWGCAAIKSDHTSAVICLATEQRN